LAIAVAQKRALVEAGHPQLSLRRQWAWLGLAGGSWYDQPLGPSVEAVERMRVLDEPYTATPFDGSRRRTAWLRSRGSTVNHTRVGRLLRQMGWEAISPKPRLSQPAASQVLYPDLLRGITVNRVNQVWSADITSSRLASGVVYLVAVIDWFSRYVLSWAVSLTMDVTCCLEAVAQALRQSQPAIFTTDQGAQFTSPALTDRLQHGGIRISMDGRGRALDHVCVERLWRSVTYAEVYLQDYQSVWDARQSLTRSFRFYNRERRHQALGYRTPAAVYLASGAGHLHQGHLTQESIGHSEVLTPNVFCPQNGLDDGVHLKYYSTPTSARVHNVYRV
jgi:putative transposase